MGLLFKNVKIMILPHARELLEVHLLQPNNNEINSNFEAFCRIQLKPGRKNYVIKIYILKSRFINITLAIASKTN